MSANMTRLEAAERAVVEAAIEIVAHNRAIQTRGVAIGRVNVSLPDTVERLLDLRASLRAEECREGNSCLIGPDDRVTGDEMARERVTCHLPKGHEGQHEAALGVWRWS